MDMTSGGQEVHFLDHSRGGFNYGVPSSEVTGGQITPKAKRKRTGGSRIKVCVRKRPLSKREEKRERDVVEVDEDGCGLLVREEKLAVDLRKVWLVHKFQFDEVFSADTSNEGVYERTAKLFLPFVLKGGKATCFAFGQTGAGKTHTLLGDRNGKGLYQFAAEDLFECLKAEAECDGVVVWISYFEIYCGQLYDLLNKRERIQALENGKHQVCITGVNEVPVSGPQTLNQFIEQGNSLRSQGSSGVNTSSSRSHAVLQMQLKDVTGNKLGRLSFIDLAGSERACDRGDPDKTTRLEGAEINTSLLALKECIRAMDQEHTHTPFRQSKLTQVLRDSFIGQSLTCMVASISPGSAALEHTMNTLRYADRVKEIHKLAYNSHQFSSAPKNFTPNNTSTPLKPQKNVRTSSLTPRRTSLPAQNLDTASTPDVGVKRRSSMLTNSPRLHETLEKKVGSELKGSPRRKEKQGSKVNQPVKEQKKVRMYQNESQSNDEIKNRRNSVKLSSAIHREVVDGEVSKIRQSQCREKDDAKVSFKVDGLKESDIHRCSKSDKDRILQEKETKEERISGDGGLEEEQDERMKRQKMVRNFLSNSLPVWEDEKVDEKSVPSSNLSIGWEIENPHYFVLKESVKDDGEKEEHDLNNNSKEFDVMKFENPRYIGPKSYPQFKFSLAEENKYGEGGNVESHQNFQSLSDHFGREAVSEYVSRGDGRVSGHEQNEGEREGAGSPRSIATDSTLELLAEIDQSLRNSSVSPVPDLARRFTMDGMSHDDLLRDINILTVSSQISEKLILSTRHQKSVTKKKVTTRKEQPFHQSSEMSSKDISDQEKVNRGTLVGNNVGSERTDHNEVEIDVKTIRRQEPVGEPADAERHENRSGGRGRGNKPLHDRRGEENESGQEKNHTGSKVKGRNGEMREGYKVVSEDAGWEMEKKAVLVDRGAGSNGKRMRDNNDSSTSGQHRGYRLVYEYDRVTNETSPLQYSVPHSNENRNRQETKSTEVGIDEGGRVLKDGDTNAAKDRKGSRGVFMNGHGIDTGNNTNQGKDVDRGVQRDHKRHDGDTMVQNSLCGIEDNTVNKNRSRPGVYMKGDSDNGVMDSGELVVGDGVRSGRQNNPKRRNVSKGNSKGHYKDNTVENGNEVLSKMSSGGVEVSSGTLHSKLESQNDEENASQLKNENKPSKHWRRSKTPADVSLDKVDIISRNHLNEMKQKEDGLFLIQGSKCLKEVNLNGEVISENKQDLKSHKFHANGEWCECCSVLEQKQLWDREGADKEENGVKERLGLKEQKVIDHYRRVSLNQGSESPSRRRRNLKQRNSLPWIGAPRFTNQENVSGQEGVNESVEYVMRRGQSDGQVIRKDYASVSTSFNRLPGCGEEVKAVGTTDGQQLSKGGENLTKESVELGKSDSAEDKRHVSFKDMPKREMEDGQWQHHPPPNIVVTSNEKHKKSPRSDEKEKPLSPDLSVYSTGGYIPTVFALAQNNEAMTQVNHNLSKSGKKKRKSLKEKMSEKGIESLPSPKGFPEISRSHDKDNSRNEALVTETFFNHKEVTTWAESAKRRQRSNRKQERESFFLKDVEYETPVTPGSQGTESAHQQKAFFRETYQPLSNQWQHVRNDGRSPVVKVKLSSMSVSRDSDKDEEDGEGMMDRSNVAMDTGIIKCHINDNHNVSHDLTKQEDGWTQSMGRLEEAENCVDQATEKKSKAVENNFMEDQRGHDKDQRMDVVEVEQFDFRSVGEGEDNRKLGRRDEVLNQQNGREPTEQKGEETGHKERSEIVIEIGSDGDFQEKFGEKEGNYELLVQETEKATQEMVAVVNLDVDSSWIGHQPLSPIPESRSDEDDEVRGRITEGAPEKSQTEGNHLRPNSALEKATGHRNLSRDTILEDRHLLVRAHQEQLEELQQLCDSGWNLVNKLQLGQGDVYEYLSDSDVLLDSQERCIKTFKDQLAMYTSCSSPAGIMMNGVS